MKSCIHNRDNNLVSRLSIAFRKATRRDLPAITKIFETSLNTTKEFDDARGYLSEQMRDADNRFIVAEAGGKIAGFIAADLTSDSADAINIDQLAVDKSFRGQGIGTALMKKAEGIALRNHFEAVTLQVRADNDNAKHLYEERGYKKIGSHWWYYGDGTTAYEMKKSLVPEPHAGRWMPKFIRKWMGMTA